MALRVISTMMVDGKKVILDELPPEEKLHLMEKLENLVAEKMGLTLVETEQLNLQA